MVSAKSYNETDRAVSLTVLTEDRQHYDLVVVGGGITGAGVLREAAAKGLHVLLVEQQDFAWGTSSRSSKMVHGGLRYLGKGQFGLANDSVKERQRLIEQLPGLVDVLPFVMNHYQGKFPGPWVFDKLLAIYDFMAGKRYRRFIPEGIADYWLPGVEKQNLTGATLFADGVTDDSALVMRVISEARRYGGLALNYVKATRISHVDCEANERDSGHSKKMRLLQLEDLCTDRAFEVSADVVINATGAWTDELRACLGQSKRIRPLRGSHLVIPFWRLPVAFSVTFFHPNDNRPVFVFPWEGQTVVGTTDLDHRESMQTEASITRQELEYLLSAANTQFSQAELTEHDVVSTWSGVRPVVVDEGMAENSEASPSDEKREHEIWDDDGLISIAGGKLTTFRLLALESLEKAVPYLNGKLVLQDLKRARNFAELAPCEQAGLSRRQRKRLEARFGHDLPALLTQVTPRDLEPVGVTETLWAELRWMCQMGSVIHLDDLLLRRTRIGLLIADGAEKLLPQIQDYLTASLPWDEARWQHEIQRYRNIIHRHYSLPTASAHQEGGHA